MNPLKFAPFLFTLLLLATAVVPAAAVDYTVTGTVTQNPSDPVQLGINGANFELAASVVQAAFSSDTTSSYSEASYDISSMEFVLDDAAPNSCTGPPTMTLSDSVSGSDFIWIDFCDTEYDGLPASLDGFFTIPGGNMATSAPADITSTGITGTLTLWVFGPKDTFIHNFTLNGGSLEASGAEPPAVTIMPSSISLSAALGSTTSEEQVVSFTASQAVSYSISTSGGSWLDVTPMAGNTSSTITVSANPTGLLPGIHSGSVMLSYGSQAEDSIPVAFEIIGPPSTLSLDPSSFVFDYQQGAAAPAAQQLDVTSSSPIAVDDVVVSTMSGGSWLSANPTTGATPLGVSLSVDPSSLAPGTYNGMVTVTSSGASNSPQTASVTLNVTPVPTISVNPSSLTFNFQLGGTAPASQGLDVSATNGPVSFTAGASTMSGGDWLSVMAASGDTPQTLSVSVDTSGLAAGSYGGTVTVSADDASNSPRAIPVTLNVSEAPVLNVAPSQLTFSHQIGESAPAAQMVNVTGSEPLTYTVAASGGNWLSVSSMSGDTPGSLNVLVNPAGLAAGTYDGVVSIASADAGNSPQTVAVALNVTAQPLSVTPTQLSFSHQLGTAAPPFQVIQVFSEGTSSFSVSTSGGPWLSATPESGTTPETLTVTVDPSGLEPGTYDGGVTVTQDGGSPTLVGVLLTVSSSPLLTAVPVGLSFTYYVNGEMPTPRMVSLSATEATSFAATASGADWLGVGSDGDTTPASLTVMVDPMGLDPGEYLGEITVTAEAAGNSPVVIPVALNVILVPLFSSENLLNAASFALEQSPASGGLASVFGFFPGVTDEGAADIPLPPEMQDVTIRMRSKAVALNEADEKGQDEHVPAPLLFVSDGQINFQIPWETPPGLTEMIVTVDGLDSEPVEVLLAEVNPGIFTYDFGPGRAVAFMPNGVLAQPVGSIPNVTSQPIQIGEVLVILATGLGPLTGPPMTSGDNSLDESGAYVRRDTAFAVRVFIGGQEAQVLFSGSSPQFVGVNQVNVIVPEGVEPGTEVTIVLEVNGLPSRSDVTIAVDPAQ